MSIVNVLKAEGEAEGTNISTLSLHRGELRRKA